ncbi:tyrosine-type recombinase/integrase [Nocardia sp. NBC_01730]|uniref:tyrosine-type recombinase/integrase n=1 Tax=Nocardia sp. NBC_01730 TaxID=2975998 RepID=UPI003FA35BA9
MPPAVGRAIDRATGDRDHGPILLNTRGRRMDRHCATRRLRRLTQDSAIRLPRMHPHMLRHTFVTTMLDAGVDLRASRSLPTTLTLAPPCAMTVLGPISTATRIASSPPTWPRAHNNSTRAHAEFRVFAGAWTPSRLHR